jgi:phosphomannomutase
MEISPHIFRAYDIRGLYNKDITPETMYCIGLAAGSYLKNNLQGSTMTVGNDLRQSSHPLVHAFMAGASATGVEVTYVGTTAFGQTLFAGWQQHHDLIAFVTASHLPPEWNGVKFYFGDGVGLPEQELMKIRDRTLNKEYTLEDWKTLKPVHQSTFNKQYTEFLASKVHLTKPWKLAVDCGGASTTLSAPEVYKAAGFDVVPVFCDPDPTFSPRPSDPKPKHLTAVVEAVKQNRCDFGVAFDGDGDRAVIIDNTGKVLSADETGILIGKHGLKEKQGTVIANVECSKAVPEQLEPLGYTVKHIQVGHTFLTLEAKQEHSPMGIESSGHLIFPEFFLFDDALVVPLKIAHVLENTKQSLSKLLANIPTYPRNKEEIECSDEHKFDVVNLLKTQLSQEYTNINTLDGVRVNLDNGWVLIRPSNTSPIIRLTAEANTPEDVKAITATFLQKIITIIEQQIPA